MPYRIDVANAKQVLDPRLLELFVFPTEQCNFRCTYCYEDFSIGRMKRDVVEGLKKLIASRLDDLNLLAISWFGGEPLLALDSVLEVSSFASKLFSCPGKKFRGHATTNGYLLGADVFRQLLCAGVRSFQITLDGPEAEHNQRRKRADGNGTFGRIWENLLKIAELIKDDPQVPFHITLRIHYDAVTAYRLTRLVADIKRHFPFPEHFAIQFHEVERLGGPNDATLLLPSDRERQLVARLIEAESFDGTLSFSRAEAMENYVCYAARANSFTIRADGRIGKCTVALNDERNVIGRLCSNGSVQIDNEALRPWLRGLFTSASSELECPWRNFPERLYNITNSASKST